MAWGDYLSESFADRLSDAGHVLMLVASIAGFAGFFSGTTPLLIGAGVAGFAGMVVPPVYGLIASIARSALGSQPDDWVAFSPQQPQATIEKQRPSPEAGCESGRHQELEALRQAVADRYRSL